MANRSFGLSNIGRTEMKSWSTFVIPFSFAFIILRPWALFTGAPTLITEPDVLGALFALAIGAILTRKIDDEKNRSSFFRYDQAVSVSLTLLGFAVLNLVRGDTVSILFPRSFEFTRQSYAIHGAAVVAAILTGLLASHLFTRLANQTALSEQSGNENKIVRRHMRYSKYLLSSSAATFGLYMGLALNQLNDRSPYEVMLVPVGIAFGGLFFNDAIRRVRERRKPHIFLKDGKIVFPIGFGGYPSSMLSILDRNAIPPVDWKYSVFVGTPSVFPSDTDEGIISEVTLLQGPREVGYHQEELAKIRVKSTPDQKEVTFEAEVELDDKGKLRIQLIDPNDNLHIDQPREIVLQPQTPFDKFVDRFRIFVRRLAHAANFWLDKRRLSKLVAGVTEVERRIAALENWRTIEGNNTVFQLYGPKEQEINEFKELMRAEYNATQDFLVVVTKLQNKLRIHCNRHGISIAPPGNDV